METPRTTAIRTIAAVPDRELAALVPRQRPSTDILDMLSAGIPLTLLLDLASPDGPDSRAILADEAGTRSTRQTA